MSLPAALELASWTRNPWLIAGAAGSTLAGVMHLGCLVFGRTWFVAMGAGTRMADLAEAGHWYPTAITLAIAGLLFAWAAYALSGAGLIPRLPLLRTCLCAITAVYLLRGVARPVLEPSFPGNSETFWFWSSAICAGLGVVHLIGLWKAWPRLALLPAVAMAFALLASGVSARVVNGGAGTEGDQAAAMHPTLPRDAALVADRLDNCVHFAGEFNGDGSEHDAEVNRTMADLRCDTIRQDAEAIREKYPDNPHVQAALTPSDDL